MLRFANEERTGVEWVRNFLKATGLESAGAWIIIQII